MGTMMTLAEVAEYVRAPESTVRFWRHKGTGPKSFKIGRRVMFRQEDVEAWLEEQYSAGAAEAHRRVG